MRELVPIFFLLAAWAPACVPLVPPPSAESPAPVPETPPVTAELAPTTPEGFAGPWEPLALPQIPAAAPRVVSHGSRAVKRVALTFDACSTRRPSEYDEQVTKVLLAYKAAATLFLGGKWMEEHPEHTRYLATFPQFELGNHSYVHPHFPEIPEKRMREELEKTEQILYSLTGLRSRYFRPPYGEYDQRTVQVAASLALTVIDYDLASGDPDVKFTKGVLVRYVTRTARSGSIIVMHMNRHGHHTAEALPEIVEGLRKRGFELVTVGELLGEGE